MSSFLAAVTGRRQTTCRTASWWLSPELASVCAARRLTREKLAHWGLDDQVETAELLVSELVGNAVEHAYGPVRLSFSAEDGLLRCEVEDENPDLPHLRVVDADAESGRGLFLVDVLSCCWGGERTARGKAIWFELPACDRAETDTPIGALAPVAA
ncbi:ATP-binding protein [Nonomuraea angiospora]|uniref:ATP-binding protein n=1 Tax=Nonomuraea angiospora TaxID=46172 RepID=UPI0029AFBA43|nr:ATP-binding protein [Nonomuraea angiospora]MDX3109612.1 ATP-binding protein [Nonomuraea angiospora]